MGEIEIETAPIACAALTISRVSLLSRSIHFAAATRVDTRTNDGSALKRCRAAMRALAPFAVRELAENADALLAPVRMGLVSAVDVGGEEASAEEVFASCIRVVAPAPPPGRTK
jgi:hypothetical protein